MKVLVFGTTMFSSQLSEILKREGIEILGYTVDKAYKDSDFFNDLPVYPFEDIELIINLSETEVVLTIGYNQMNDVRRTKYLECKRRGIKVFTYVSKEAQVYTNEIGEGSIIMPGVYVGPFSKLGICCVLWPGTVLAHHNILDDFNWVASCTCYGGGASSGKNCFLGIGSTIRNEIKLAEYTFVGAQTYIGKETTPKGVYVGVPARKKDKINSYEIVAKV